jgi:predicted nucleic acid-binding protein
MKDKPELFLDTNILIYATLEQDPRFFVAQKLLLNLDNKYSCLYISTQNLSDMYPNLTGLKMTKPDNPKLAGEKIRAIASLPHIRVLPVTINVIHLALELSEKYNVNRQYYFDIQLVATMLIHNISLLASENEKDFQRIKEIDVFNPFFKQ